jgi:hypothetical protein
MEDGGFVEAKRSSRSAWKSPDFSFLSAKQLSALRILAQSSYQHQCNSCTVERSLNKYCLVTSDGKSEW